MKRYRIRPYSLVWWALVVGGTLVFLWACGLVGTVEMI